MVPLWEGRQKDSEQVFLAGFVLLMPHHQGFTSSIYLILFGPPTHAPLFMHYVKQFETASTPQLSITPFFLLSFIYLSLNLLLIFSPFLSPGPSPCFYPFHPVKACVCVCVCLWERVSECVWERTKERICLSSVFFMDWLPARTVKALPAARTWKMHRISLW